MHKRYTVELGGLILAELQGGQLRTAFAAAQSEAAMLGCTVDLWLHTGTRHEPIAEVSEWGVLS